MQAQSSTLYEQKAPLNKAPFALSFFEKLFFIAFSPSIEGKRQFTFWHLVDDPLGKGIAVWSYDHAIRIFIKVVVQSF